MRSDRELLALAAKAADVKAEWVDTPHEQCFKVPYQSTDGLIGGWKVWNALTDDGDALRLAADLDLFGSPSYWHWLAIARLENSVDKHANVRRAIVRAAAEIGAQAHPDNKDGGA